MASRVYPKYKEALLNGVVDLRAVDVKAMLVDLDNYTYSASHEFLADVPSAAREEISPALTTKTTTDGVFDADDTSFPAATGDPCEAVILFVDTGNEATSRLLTYMDSGTGLPVILNGGTVTLTWPNDATRIFALTDPV